MIAERDEMRDRLMRALAEAENVRKRAARDRTEAEQYGGSRLARDLLPVYDNLRRALDAVGEGNEAIAEGIELTLRELRSVFEKHGVRVVAPAIGDRFDPQIHQAMFEAPLPDTKAGEIIQVMAEGFMLHDRLLRPAQVGVSSRPRVVGGEVDGPQPAVFDANRFSSYISSNASFGESSSGLTAFNRVSTAPDVARRPRRRRPEQRQVVDDRLRPAAITLLK